MKKLKNLRNALVVASFVCANLFLFGLLDAAGFLFKIQLLPAIPAFNIGVASVVLLTTILFGRVYCSVVCPMGQPVGFAHSC